MKTIFLRFTTVLILLCSASGVIAQQMPVVELSAGMYRIQAELAATEPARQTGLMHRESMPEGAGMVFLFDSEARHCMWMKNTLIPLSVAFLNAEGVIFNIADMTPHSEESHCATGAARFALEMNQGWFEQRGIGPGDRVRGVEHLLR